MVLNKLSDYVEEVQAELGLVTLDSERAIRFSILIEKRVGLLKQKPTLGMFVRCDLEGNVLEEPINPRTIEPQPNFGQDDYDGMLIKWIEYKEAEKRVLFKGFSYDGRILSNDNIDMDICNDNLYLLDKPNKIETLEDLTPYNLELK